MSSKLSGQQWETRSGITIDTPEAGIIDSPERLLWWSDQAGCPLVFMDVKITRRLRAHVLVSRPENLIKAFGNDAELWEWCCATGTKQVAIVEEMLDDSAIVWYVNARTNLLRS